MYELTNRLTGRLVARIPGAALRRTLTLMAELHRAVGEPFLPDYRKIARRPLAAGLEPAWARTGSC